MDPDGRSYTFKLKKGVKYHDGEAFDAADVKFSFERAKDDKSTNKAKKAVFDNIARIDTPDAHTVILTLNNADGNFLFRMGENTAVILDPKSAAGTATKPVGTGPFTFDDWKKGSSVTLAKWHGYRDAKSVKLERVTFRFINDPAARVAALLAGDIDGVPRLDAPQAVKQLQADPRFVVTIGSTAGKGIMSINNKKKPFDDVRVRRALMHAIDRKAFIDGVLEGLGKPIGSHFAPTDAGYIDLTGVYPYDPEKAKALLKEAGVATPLNVTLTLPPPQYARKGGEVLAAQLAKVGIVAKIENVEWAQWLGGTFKGNFDLTVINHVEPLDYMQYANTGLLLGLRQQGLPRPGGQARRGDESEGPRQAVRRPAATDHGRRGQRLHLQSGPGGGVEEGAEGPVVELADLRQRHGLGVLAMNHHEPRHHRAAVHRVRPARRPRHGRLLCARCRIRR